MKVLRANGSKLIAVTALLAVQPLSCGDDSSNAADDDDPVGTGANATGGFGTGLPGATGGAFASTGGAGFTPGTGGSTPTEPPPSEGPNPDYNEIDYARCVPEFCPAVAGAEACCLSADGPCGADYGEGCTMPGWQNNNGSGGFSWGGFPGWWETGGNGGGGSGGNDSPDASPEPPDAGIDSGGPTDAGTD